MALLTPGLMSLASVANGSSGYSNAFDLSLGRSSNESWENGFGDSISGNFSDSYSNAKGVGDSWNYSENGSENTSYDAIYGSEASARDIMRAAEANIMQDYFMRRQMEFNSLEAEKARAYETIMSNTSYQRAVRDLKAAGLNPVLAALNMGASTPAAAVASSGLANASKAQTFADARGSSRGSSYGYSQGGSHQESYQTSRSHSEGYSRSHNENNGGSKGSSSNYGIGYNRSQHTNNLQKALNGLGDFFNGLSNGMKTGKGWDGYDSPLNY